MLVSTKRRSLLEDALTKRLLREASVPAVKPDPFLITTGQTCHLAMDCLLRRWTNFLKIERMVLACTGSVFLSLCRRKSNKLTLFVKLSMCFRGARTLSSGLGVRTGEAPTVESF